MNQEESFAALSSRVAELEADLEAALTRERSRSAREDSRYRNLFEYAPVSIWEEDFTKVGHWFDELRAAGVTDVVAHLEANPEEVMRAVSFVEIVGVNQAALHLLGLDSKRRVIGNFKKIFKGETEHIFLAELKALWDGQTRLSFEHGGRRQTGEEFYSLLEMHVPVEDGRPNLGNVIVAITDITARKKAEQLRLDMEHMVRHDIKSPLTAVIGFSTLLAQDKALDEEQAEMAQAIEESGYAMLELINRSLDMYKMETGNYHLEPAPVDLLELMSRVMADQSATAAGYGVGLAMSGPNGGPPPFLVVQAEELLLYSMFANLVKNAVEATDQGGEVTVVLEPGDPVRVRVSNPGTVAEEIRDIFFDKYATSGKSGGSGLGTYSARLIAKAHGGSIFLETSEEDGTTVTVGLPA